MSCKESKCGPLTTQLVEVVLKRLKEHENAVEEVYEDDERNGHLQQIVDEYFVEHGIEIAFTNRDTLAWTLYEHICKYYHHDQTMYTPRVTGEQKYSFIEIMKCIAEMMEAYFYRIKTRVTLLTQLLQMCKQNMESVKTKGIHIAHFESLPMWIDNFKHNLVDDETEK